MTSAPRYDLFLHLKLALKEATGHQGLVETDPLIKAPGNYDPSTTNITVRDDTLLHPADLCHTMVHEFGHYLVYKAFDRMGRRQSEFAVISLQARARVLTALWPRLESRPLSLRYYQQVSGASRNRRAKGAEFPAEIVAAYLLAHVVPPYLAEESGLQVRIAPWPRLPELLWKETWGYSQLCPKGSKLLAAMQREVEALVKLPEPVAA